MHDLHGGDPRTLILDELSLCQGAARVDLAVVNGNLHGYEIKSQRDTLTRLPIQQHVYSRCFDFITMVVAPNHASKAHDNIPEWWGLWRAVHELQGVRLEPIREPRQNPSIEPLAVAQLLWRDEALALLAEHHLADGMKSKPKGVLWRRLADQLSIHHLTFGVREALKQRRWRELGTPTSSDGSSRPSAR